MSSRQSARYLRTASHSSQIVNSFELEEKQHPIQSMSESVHHHIIPSSVGDPSSHSDHPPLKQSSSIPSIHNNNNIHMTIPNHPPHMTDPSPSSSFQHNQILDNNTLNRAQSRPSIPTTNNRQQTYDEVQEESKSNITTPNNYNNPNINNTKKRDTSPELQEVRIFEPGYSQWQGTNKICCKGRIIGGPEIWKLLVTITIIIIPTIVYLAFTYEHINKYAFCYMLTTYKPILCVYDTVQGYYG